MSTHCLYPGHECTTSEPCTNCKVRAEADLEILSRNERLTLADELALEMTVRQLDRYSGELFTERSAADRVIAKAQALHLAAMCRRADALEATEAWYISNPGII